LHQYFLLPESLTNKTYADDFNVLTEIIEDKSYTHIPHTNLLELSKIIQAIVSNILWRVMGTGDAIKIGNWFYYNLTRRDYNYLLHCYTFTQLPISTLLIFSFCSERLLFTWKLPTANYNCLSRQSQSQSHIATDGQSVSKSWCRAPSGAHDQIFIAV
jgi:hypothetical protein